MKQTIKRAAVAVVAVVALSACSNDPSAPGDARGTFRTAVVDVDGRKVPCITWKQGYAGGLSCDWRQP